MAREKRRRGPTPSRAARGLGSKSSRTEQARAVRVVCDGCGGLMFNGHARGDLRDGTTKYVEPCPSCGSETCTFHSVALAPAGLYEVAA